VDRVDANYTVLTNAHVLRADNPPYRIQTPDGEIYKADVLIHYGIALVEGWLQVREVNNPSLVQLD
jgi:hypothetical protein